jgi:hypothetical protein
MATATQQLRTLAEKHQADEWYFGEYSAPCSFGTKCPSITCPREDVSKVKAAARRLGIRSKAKTETWSSEDRVIVYWGDETL